MFTNSAIAGGLAAGYLAVVVLQLNPQYPIDPGTLAPLAVMLGAAYGLSMWVVNFYGILIWLQPRLVGQAYVLELMPAWVAALTHVIYGVTLGVLQPLGRFVPYRGGEQHA